MLTEINVEMTGDFSCREGLKQSQELDKVFIFGTNNVA